MDSLILSFLNTYSGYIKKTLPRLKDLHLNGDNITAKVTRNNLFNTLLFLKHDWLHQAKLCLDVTAYDQPGKILRFSVIYSLESTEYNSRYQVYTQTDPYLGLETITSIYSSANWSEREVWDFFGIIFWNHPDLRRILTDYGFDGYPLRKDFPLTGYVEKIYSHTDKVVADRGVELSQELRSYKYEDTWINEQQ